MRKLLTIIATMIMCNAYGEVVYWIKDGSLSSFSECTSGSNITEPNTPTKDGYRFIGWQETQPTWLSTNGTSVTPASSGGTNVEWTVTLPWGKITGTSLCSKTSCGNVGTLCTKDNDPGGGRYCHCKLTNIAGENVSSLLWMYLREFSSDCSTSCAYSCGINIKNYYGYRLALFNVSL